MDWYAYIKRYVWDDEKTPYFVPVAKLKKSQADYELFAFTFFMGLLFAIVSLISLTENAVYGESLPAALYAFSVSGAAVLFAVTRHVACVYYMATAPLVVLAAMAAVILGGLAPELAAIDKVVIIVICLCLLRYSLRVVAITKGYPEMPGNGQAD